MHNFCHSGAKSMLQRKGVLLETNTKTNFPGKSTHEIKSLTNMGFVISAENILSQPLCWKYINLDTAGRSHFYKENCKFARKYFQNRLPRWVTCLLFYTRWKALKMQDCNGCGKYCIKFTVLEMHKFCHSGATTNMFTNEEIVKHVENIFLKPLSWRCITSVIVGRSQYYKEKALYERQT